MAVNDQHDHARLAYIAMAALAGSITALSMQNWKSMPWSEVVLTVFVGMSFAIFAVPWLAHDWANIDIDNLRAICGVTYLGATGANVLLPLAIRKARTWFGEGA